MQKPVIVLMVGFLLMACSMAGAQPVAPSQAPGGVSQADLMGAREATLESRASSWVGTMGSYFQPEGPFDYYGNVQNSGGWCSSPTNYNQQFCGNVTCTQSWFEFSLILETVSSRIWHGYDKQTSWTDHPGGPDNRTWTGAQDPSWSFAPIAAVSFGNTGLHAALQTFVGPAKYENYNATNYSLYWEKMCLDLVMLDLGFNYYDYNCHLPDWQDSYELFAGFVFTGVPLNPAYHYMHDWQGSDFDGPQGGDFHVFGLSQPVPLVLGPFINCYQEFNVMWDIWYNTGWNGSASGFSHSTFGVETDIPLGCGAYFTPGIYYQISMEDSVNPENEFWAKFSLNIPLTSHRR